jgi:hypothetical protein
MQQIMQLASPLNATQVVSGGSNVDSGPWGQAGVPFGAPMVANQVSTAFLTHLKIAVFCVSLHHRLLQDYFQFHHTVNICQPLILFQRSVCDVRCSTPT